MSVLKLTAELMNLRREAGPVGDVEGIHGLPVLGVLQQDNKNSMCLDKGEEEQETAFCNRYQGKVFIY